MFSGFWGWFFVVLIVGAIFYANKLPDLRKEAEEKMKQGLAALEKGRKELEKKVNEKTKKSESPALQKDKNEDDESNENDPQ